MAEKDEDNLSADSFGTDADSELATALRVARSPKHDLTVAADVHETGKILNLKKTRLAAIKEGQSSVAKMTLEVALKPDHGVTVFENTIPPNVKKPAAGSNTKASTGLIGSKKASQTQVPVLKELPPNF